MTPKAKDRPELLQGLQRPPTRIPEDASKPSPLLFDDEHQPIKTVEAWSKRREELRRRWRAFLGEIPIPEEAPTLEVIEEDRPEGVIRQLIRYEAEPGLPIEAYLLRPDAEGQGRPGVVILHATTALTIRQPAGLEGKPDRFIGPELARLGFVVLCPRNFLWQYSQGNKLIQAVEWLRERHPGVTGMEKMLFDARRAVDLLASLPDVDPNRIGSFGHSLGAKETLYLAAFDDRVRATVSSEGGIGLSYSNWEAPWYLGEAIQRPGFGLDHGQVLAMAAPRAFLLIGGDSADGDRSWPYIEATHPIWKLEDAPDALGFLNHQQGHAFPEVAKQTSFAWLEHFLS